ncbi:unnamed protein product [Eruca vesicaria subsp. sativa]|uniref:SAM domain-containing protein n=1 Tax=Eruca vesicaria subsp. sativa TaxID=29727 RepID=A0ABC8LW23_ERUVS|nr:unnamed protein product [Eruca vesicaria subsp. sativa]
MEVSPTQYKVIEAVLMTTLGGVVGAVFGGLLGRVTSPRNLAVSLSRIQHARVCARECSAFGAAQLGIYSIVSGIRGKDDLTSNVVSASGSGAVLSFMKQGLKGQPSNALSHAAIFAVISGTAYKVSERKKTRNAQDAFYTEARAMLSKLGLEEYEKNFKKGHFTDCTLPLLTDSVLQEVNIPPGPRLLILDHIKRYNKMVKDK